jgi:hypothetical protein
LSSVTLNAARRSNAARGGEPPHDCEFPEVLIDSEDGPLKPGMLVLAPCECGETPLDHVELLERDWTEATAALTECEPRRALFHWAPRARRGQILRLGLVPGRRPTTSSSRTSCICFADSPSWAWALSGEQRAAPAGEWDLWQTSLDLLQEPVVLPSTDRSSGIHEVRTVTRVPKRDLWWVGSRTKP